MSVLFIIKTPCLYYESVSVSRSRTCLYYLLLRRRVCITKVCLYLEAVRVCIITRVCLLPRRRVYESVSISRSCVCINTYLYYGSKSCFYPNVMYLSRRLSVLTVLRRHVLIKSPCMSVLTILKRHVFFKTT